MTLERQRPPAGDQGGADDDSGVGISLPSLPGYVVLMITRHGMPRRKVYLDLGHARTAVARARGKGLDAWLVLCELRAVAGDLGGGDQQ
jgi:hypothetical protein